MTTITFENCSKLKLIGERAFAKSRLISITIPASTQEIDGLAFVGCPILRIQIERGSRNFKIEGNLLLASDGNEIVRSFGGELEVTIPAKVEILKKSCFEGCNHIERLLFENGSKLRLIGRYALSDCESLQSISIPESVTVIEEAAFKGSIGLESCIISDNANLVNIEKEAFSECHSLRSFSVPESVSVLGENWFYKCHSLHRLRFATSELLKKLVSNSTLDEVLEGIGLNDISSLLRIELAHGGVDFELPGWSVVVDRPFRFALVHDLPF
jgi:hypothetical protein